MSGVPRQTQLRSVTITGLSVVTLTFEDGTNDYFARQQVLEKLQGVNLPPDIQPTLAPLTKAVGEVYRYIVEAPVAMPDSEVRALQDWVIRPGLRSVPGVADVVSFGGTVKEYQVRVDPQAAQALRPDDGPGQPGAELQQRQCRRRLPAPRRRGAHRARHRAVRRASTTSAA